MSSFRGAMIISIETLQPSILSRALYIFLTLKFLSTTFAIALYFSVFQNTNYRQLLFEAATFSEQIIYIFRKPSCLEKLLLSNL